MAKKPERVPVGRGADAFFPATEEETSQDTGKPAEQQASIPVKQDDAIAGEQPTSLPAQQESTLPVSHLTGTPGKQDTSIPVRQHTGKTGEQSTGKPVFMKATYYITPEQDLKLEQIRLARRERGERVDKSALIREAIDLLVDQ